MSIARGIAPGLFAAGMLAMAGAWGQDYPSKPVRMVTVEAGGGTDVAARNIAAGIARHLGQSVVVENRPGANGILANQTVARAPADGYTLLFSTSSLWLLPLMQDDVPYDAVKDFAPVSLAIRQPNLLVVHQSVPAQSVKELIDLAKAKPGTLNFATSNAAGSVNLAAQLFKSLANVDIVGIPYKGSAPGVAALVAGQVQLMFVNSGLVSAHIKAGKLRALAVTSLKPSELLPGLMPIAATPGLSSYEAVANYGVLAPANTQRTIIARLNREIVRLLGEKEVRQQFLKSGVDVVASSPEEFAATIKSDMAMWGKVIKEAGIRAD